MEQVYVLKLNYLLGCAVLNAKLSRLAVMIVFPRLIDRCRQRVCLPNQIWCKSFTW